jgi:hypothetical protein
VTKPLVDIALDSIQSIFRQALINGNFDVWQRGTNFTSGYTADRWCGIALSSSTISKQIATPPIGSTSYMRATVNALGGYANFGQPFESDVCNKLKGKYVSLSVLIRRDATYDGQYQLFIDKNSAANTSGGTWVNVGSSTPYVLTTSWVLYKLENVLIPSDANGLRVQIAALNGTRPANSYIEFAQCQFNVGPVILPFQPKSYGEELRDCIGFCEIWNLGNGEKFGIGIQLNATTATCMIRFQPKRAIPTITGTGVPGDFGIVGLGGGIIPATVITFTGQSITGAGVDITVASGLVGGYAAALSTMGGGKYIIIDSEIY